MKNMLTTAFLQMTFFQAEISCLVKMSWSIKQIVCFSFNQRRVKAILDAFFKNSHARVEDILNVRTDGLDCVICLWLTATYYLKFSLFEPKNITFNAQLSWRKTFATFSTSFSMEPLRMTCHQVTQLFSNTIKTVLFVSFWNVLEHFVNVYKDSVRKLYREMNFNG